MTPPAASSGRRSAGFLLLGVLLWLALALVIDPVGDFPLNDDWSYGRTVSTLVTEGRYEPTGWTSMPLLPQVLWGALFCLPDGFSFTALRLSTLLLGALGLLATWGFLRECGVRRGAAAIGTALVATNPLYLQLSYTFMTDVPFTAAAMGSLALLARSLRREDDRALAVGIALAVVATLIRQLGLVIPLAYAVAIVARDGWRRGALIRAVLAPAVVGGALAGYTAWLTASGRLPALYDLKLERLAELAGHGTRAYALRVAGLALDAVTELGLMVMPAVVAAVGARRRLRASVVGLGVGFILLQAYRLWQESRGLPLSPSVLFDLGLGPVALRDVGILVLPHWPSAPAGVWTLLTATALIGGGVVVARWVAAGVGARRARSGGIRDGVSVLTVTAIAGYLLGVAVVDYYDRYLLLLLPLVAALLLKAGPLRRAAVPAAGLILS